MSCRAPQIEMTETTDPLTGATVRRLTNRLAHSWHFYFTYSGWWQNDSQLLFHSHRDDLPGTYSMDLTTHEIQLVCPGMTSGYFETRRMELYGVREGHIVGRHIVSGEERIIYDTKPDSFGYGGLAAGADGKYLCVGLSQRNQVDTKGLGQGYVGMQEYFDSKPLCRILRIDLDTGKAEVVHEERNWIGHINPSPTQGDLFTFCHEGPWQKVNQRIWGLNIASGKVWQIRPRTRTEDAVGHEFWLADGKHVGYQGWMPEGPVYGVIRHDNTSGHEEVLSAPSEHFHANTTEYVVGDGMRNIPYLLLWRFNGSTHEGPRVLCQHRSSRHVQTSHVHPRFSPDGKYVLYTSDTTGYANLYQAFLPSFDALPTLDQIHT